MSTGTCTEIVDDGKRVCASPVTDDISWADLSRAEYPPPTPEQPYRTFTLDPDGRMKSRATYPHKVTRRVCGTCADWLMGLGGSHLKPSRTPIS
jgi:hypothetical protein